MANKGGQFRFRVSDAVDVPLRGLMLRLRLVEGTPSVKDLAVGRQIQVASPNGETRQLRIAAHSLTGGKQNQERLDRIREMDLIVEEVGGGAGATPIEIGWMATGPVDERS